MPGARRTTPSTVYSLGTISSGSCRVGPHSSDAKWMELWDSHFGPDGCPRPPPGRGYLPRAGAHDPPEIELEVEYFTRRR
jgi:hypothetical protein